MYAIVKMDDDEFAVRSASNPRCRPGQKLFSSRSEARSRLVELDFETRRINRFWACWGSSSCYVARRSEQGSWEYFEMDFSIVGHNIQITERPLPARPTLTSVFSVWIEFMDEVIRLRRNAAQIDGFTAEPYRGPSASAILNDRSEDAQSPTGDASYDLQQSNLAEQWKLIQILQEERARTTRETHADQPR